MKSQSLIPFHFILPLSLGKIHFKFVQFYSTLVDNIVQIGERVYLNVCMCKLSWVCFLFLSALIMIHKRQQRKLLIFSLVLIFCVRFSLKKHYYNYDYYLLCMSFVLSSGHCSICCWWCCYTEILKLQLILLKPKIATILSATRHLSRCLRFLSVCLCVCVSIIRYLAIATTSSLQNLNSPKTLFN